MMRPTIGIIGAGKVGCALARLLSEAGYTIGAASSQSSASAGSLAETVGAAQVESSVEVARQVDLILLTVPDDRIEAVSAEIAQADLSGKGVVHTSGAHDAHSLKTAADRGGWVGSLHPAFPFADCEQSVRNLPGATFAVEAADTILQAWLLDIVAALKGHPLLLPAGSKALYHAALVLVSNYTVTLYATAENLLLGLWADRAAADAALSALLEATAVNIRQQGIPQALTGPLVRSDTGTIAAHVFALAQVDEQLTQTYLHLARLSLPLLTARGLPTAAIERQLGET